MCRAGIRIIPWASLCSMEESFVNGHERNASLVLGYCPKGPKIHDANANQRSPSLQGLDHACHLIASSTSNSERGGLKIANIWRSMVNS